MIFHHQLYTDDDLVGDCWRTCVGNLLGLPPGSVPHFAKEAIETGEWFITLTEKWLRERNLTLKFDSYPPDGLAIATGRSPRSSCTGHSIIVDGSGQDLNTEPPLLHDPHPSGDGLLTQETYFWIEPFSLSTENFG